MQTEPLNPYESPRESNLPLPRKQLIEHLRGPSIGLLVLSGLQAGYLLAMCCVLGVLLANNNSSVERMWRRAHWSDIAVASVGVIVGFLPSAFILFGAWQMRRMRSLRLSRVAAITACIPFLSPVVFLGIPYGIWAAAVLFQKSTAEEFDRTVNQIDLNRE